MRQVQMTVLERLLAVDSTFDTEPYECGWASEGIFFVNVNDSQRSAGSERGRVTSYVQLSADGLTWVNEGTSFSWPGTTGLCFGRIAHFGNWLRLHSVVEGNPTLRATIQLVLKE